MICHPTSHANNLLKRFTNRRTTADRGAALLAASPASTWRLAGGCCVAVLLSVTGCRGRAQEDFYRQSLQREVRQLEDQLYEADYENRVLIDELRSERVTSPASEEMGPSRSGRAADPSDFDPSYVPAESPDFGLDDALGSQRDSSGSEAKSNRPPSSSRETSGREDSRRETIPAGPKASDAKQSPKPVPDADRSDSEDDELPDIDSLIEPGQLVDPGDLVDPETLIDPGTLESPSPKANPSPKPNPSPKAEDEPAGKSGKDNEPSPDVQLLPPPGGPVPPGTPDLELEPIDPGIPMPPGSLDGQPDDDPSKIELPGVSMLGGLGPVAGSTPKIELQPVKIRIDAITSKVRMNADEKAKLRSSDGEQKDAEKAVVVVTKGVDLTIRADDQYGHPIAVLGRTHDPIDPLRSPDAAVPRPLPTNDARLTIIALDPTKAGEDAQLGRWDFDTEKLRQLETTSLANHASGYAITVPIRWRDRIPAGEAVVFFARFEAGKRDLRCESEIALNRQPSVAGWLPRR